MGVVWLFVVLCGCGVWFVCLCGWSALVCCYFVVWGVGFGTCVAILVVLFLVMIVWFGGGGFAGLSLVGCVCCVSFLLMLDMICGLVRGLAVWWLCFGRWGVVNVVALWLRRAVCWFILRLWFGLVLCGGLVFSDGFGRMAMVRVGCFEWRGRFLYLLCVCDLWVLRCLYDCVLGYLVGFCGVNCV